MKLDNQTYHLLNALGWIVIASLAYSGIYVPGKQAIFWVGFLLAGKSLIEALN